MDKKIKTSDIYEVKPQTPNFNVEYNFVWFPLCSGFEFFVHQIQAHRSKTTLKFGGVGVDNNTARV